MTGKNRKGNKMKITKRQLKRLVREACGAVPPEKDDGAIYGHGGTARMAKSQLFQVATNAAELHDMLDEEDELPEWVQSKIAIIEDNLDSVLDHLEYKHRDQYGGGDVDVDYIDAVQVVESSDWYSDQDETMADMKYRLDREDDEYMDGYHDALDGKGIDIGASPMYRAGFEDGLEGAAEGIDDLRTDVPPAKISGMGKRR